MGTVRRFEDLIAWQRARELTRLIYKLTGAGRFAKDFRLSSQIQAAATSVMSNVAEGFESGTPKKFLRFLDDARGSSAEVRSQLYVALDVGYVAQDQFDEAFGLADEAARLITALSRSIARRLSPDE